MISNGNEELIYPTGISNLNELLHYNRYENYYIIYCLKYIIIIITLSIYNISLLWMILDGLSTVKTTCFYSFIKKIRRTY